MMFGHKAPETYVRGGKLALFGVHVQCGWSHDDPGAVWCYDDTDSLHLVLAAVQPSRFIVEIVWVWCMKLERVTLFDRSHD